jgi:hypothetical protein
MRSFATTREAKEYLIGVITADAERQGPPLSETERKMLYFSETAWTLPDIDQVSLDFDLECDAERYERKMGTLARRCEQHLRRTNRESFNLFHQAERMLREEDHYLLVLIRHGGPAEPPPSFWLDRLKLVLTAAAIVALAVVASFLFAKR